ncbi:hypothetical protein, partial [Azospirillum sp. B506]|uniref:hypothetical protein n=1 Tax=Azospirillum sp. B506 TaxID=137721 RepID=UPI0005B2BED9
HCWAGDLYRVLPIRLQFGLSPVVLIGGTTAAETAAELDDFAQHDGFEDWADLREFWAREHPGITDFVGVLIRWEPRS